MFMVIIGKFQIDKEDYILFIFTIKKKQDISYFLIGF